MSKPDIAFFNEWIAVFSKDAHWNREQMEHDRRIASETLSPNFAELKRLHQAYHRRSALNYIECAKTLRSKRDALYGARKAA